MANNSDYKTYLKQLEDTLHLYLVKKAPTLPSGAKEAIVKFGPWVTLILMILTAPILLTVLGLGAFLAPFGFLGGARFGLTYIISLAIIFITLIIEAVALPGLFKRELRSWYLIYYATLLSAVSRLIEFDLGGLIIGTLISLYILFQVREYYK